MIRAYALTDVGKCRSINQDYVFCSTNPIGKLPNLFVVADGMGGHKAGDLASRFSVDTFVECVRTSDSDNPITIISDAIKYTNTKLFELAASTDDYNGMGTTFVVATIIDKSVYVANVGDSRLYLLGEGFRQITRDHSLVEEMISKGSIDREQARHHERKNVITRAMGAKADIIADFFEVEITGEETIFMCSDGLSNMIEDSYIETVLCQNMDIIDKSYALLDKANENGGKDNISLIIVEI